MTRARERRSAPPGLLPWSLVVLVTLVGALGGYVFFAQRPATYTSEARVLVGSNTSRALLQDSTADLGTQEAVSTQAEVVTSDAVLTRIVEATRLDEDDLREVIDVDVIPGSRVLAISLEGPSPSVARQRAQVVAEAFVTSSREEARSSLAAQADSLQRSATLLRRDLPANADPDDPTNQSALAALSAIQQEQSRLEAAAAVEEGPVQIIAAATLPRDPSSLSAPVGAGLAGAVALVLALGVALTLLRLRQPLP